MEEIKREEFITAYSSTFKKPSKIMELPRGIEVFKSVRFKSEAINILGKERFNHVLKQLYATPSEGGFGMSTSMIARLLKKPVSTVKLWLRELEDEKVLRLRPVIHPPKIGNLVLDLGMQCEGYEFKNGYTYVTNIYPTNELCYTICLAYGDGTIDKTVKRAPFRIRIFNADWNLLEPAFKKALKVAEIFDAKASYYYVNQANKKVYDRTLATQWVIEINSTTLASIMVTEEGEIRTDTLRKTLKPPFTWHSIGGFTAAEGWISKPPRKLAELTQPEQNLVLLEEIQKALNREKITTTLKPDPKSAKTTIYIRGRLVRTTQRLYRLRIIAKDFDKFVEKIDGKIQHPEKEERIKQHLQTF